MIRYMLLSTLGLLLSGWLTSCAVDMVDPLLFNLDGSQKQSINRHEIEAHGIDSNCTDYRDLLANADDITRVPIEGENSELVLVGVDGQALCIETSQAQRPAGDNDGALGEQTVSETEEMDEATPYKPPATPSDVQFPRMGALPNDIMSDPTPEPAGE